MQSLILFDGDVKVAHHVAREVIAGQFEEQLILIDRIGLVGYDIEEVGVAVGRQLTGIDRIAVAEHHRTSAPHIAQVELSTMKLPTLLHTVDDHAGHLCELTLGEFLHQRLHVLQAPIAVPVVELAQSIDEQELVAIGPKGEACLGNMTIAGHFLKAVFLECHIGCSIE